MGLIHRRNRQQAPPLTWESAAVSYVGPASFRVASVDRTGVYLPGRLVYLPSGGDWAAVQFAIYTGGNTLVFLSDAVCLSGLGAVAYADQARPFSPLSPSSATATYTQSGFPASHVYDGSVYTYWSDGTNTSSGTALGLVYASSVRVAALRISQHAYRGVSAVNLQYYNGSSWVTHATLTLHPAEQAVETLFFDPPASGYTQWQVVSTVAPSSGTWAVLELSMSE